MRKKSVKSNTMKMGPSNYRKNSNMLINKDKEERIS